MPPMYKNPIAYDAFTGAKMPGNCYEFDLIELLLYVCANASDAWTMDEKRGPNNG
jgi:hypothetical protein